MSSQIVKLGIVLPLLVVAVTGQSAFNVDISKINNASLELLRSSIEDASSELLGSSIEDASSDLLRSGIKEPKLCENREGRLGVCIKSYLCVNGIVVTDGAGLIKKREAYYFSSIYGCGELDQVCCPYDMGSDVDFEVTTPKLETWVTEKVTGIKPWPIAADDRKNKQPTEKTTVYKEIVGQSKEEKGIAATAEYETDEENEIENENETEKENEIENENETEKENEIENENETEKENETENENEIESEYGIDQEEEIEVEDIPPCGVRHISAVSPWLVYIKKLFVWRKHDNSKSDVAGGGTLIHPSVVLTVAHICDSNQQLQVLTSGEDRQTRVVKQVVMHERYKRGFYNNDIALLILSEPVIPSPQIAMACLPSANTAAPQQCWAHEWASEPSLGSTKTKKVLVPVVSHQECQNKLQKSRKNPRRPWKLHPSFMCAGGNHNVQFSKGDEGFPLICPKQNPEVRHMLYGMTSRDLFCGKHSDPTVYVDVAKFRDWIDAKIMAIRLTTKTYTIRDKIIIEYY